MDALDHRGNFTDRNRIVAHIGGDDFRRQSEYVVRFLSWNIQSLRHLKFSPWSWTHSLLVSLCSCIASARNQDEQTGIFAVTSDIQISANATLHLLLGW